MEYFNEDKKAIIYLLRLYFDDSKQKNPFDDKRELTVAHDVIFCLADMIIYCYNPVLSYKLEEYTYFVAEELWKNKKLIARLPESLKVMIEYRKKKIKLIDKDIAFVCQDIVTAAIQNLKYWKARMSNTLEWGKCDINDIVVLDRNELNIDSMRLRCTVTKQRPFRKEGWVPCLIHEHNIYIPDGEYISQRLTWDDDTIMITYNDEYDRPIKRSTLNKRINENDSQSRWRKVFIHSQRAWLRYIPEKYHLLPPCYDPHNYVVVTLSASFENIQGCTFFIERHPENTPFENYIGDIPVGECLVDYGEDDDDQYFNRGIYSRAYEREMRDYHLEEVLSTFDDDIDISVLSGGGKLLIRDDTEDILEENISKASGVKNLSNQKIVVSEIMFETPEFQKIYYSENSQQRFFVSPFYTRDGNHITDITERRKEKFIKMRILNTLDENTWHRYAVKDILEKLGRSEMFDNVDLFEKVVKKITIPTQPNNETDLICEYIYDNGSDTALFPNLTRGFFDLNKLLYIYLFKITYNDDVDRANDLIESLKEVKQTFILSKYKTDMPKFIIEMVIEDAIKKKTDCPIAMSPLTKGNASIISCFHIFDAESIATWANTNSRCPMCRKNISWMTEPLE